LIPAFDEFPVLPRVGCGDFLAFPIQDMDVMDYMYVLKKPGLLA
jgi:hypothetical protein